MHYYSFNISDYRKDTTHLTPIEHYIYRELMDWCYLDECSIPKETDLVLRRLRLGAENEVSLTNVLKDFFEEGENGWSQKRITKTISDYNRRAEVNRKNGKSGGRPRNQRLTKTKKPKKTHSVTSGNPDATEQQPDGNPNQELLTNNYKPIQLKGIVDLYNEILGDTLGYCRGLSDNRKKSIKARVGEDESKRTTLEWWGQYWSAVSESDFLCGRATTDRPWRASFDWLINQQNMLKIMEGKYHGR